MEQETTKLSVEERYEALKKQFISLIISLTNQLIESEAKREALEKKLKLLDPLDLMFKKD